MYPVRRPTSSLAGLAVLLTVVGTAGADILNVPSPSYPTIQSAIDAAIDGDEVVVADGTYTGFGNRDLILGIGLITVRSASGDPVLCVIDCESSARGFTIQGDGTAGPTVEGFTVLDAFTTGSGAGMWIVSSSPTIRDCIFQNGAANTAGAGIFLQAASAAVIEDCTFDGNQARLGGAMYLFGSGASSILGCAFQNNTADESGGAIVSDSGSNAVITDCSFSGNTANGAAIDEGGGAILSFDSAPNITTCTFSGNTAASRGGAIHNRDNSNAIITDCAFDQNSAYFGGALYNEFSSPTISSCSLLGNTSLHHGGGIYCALGSFTAILDCTFIGNAATDPTGGGDGGALHVSGASATVHRGLFEGNWARQGGAATIYQATAEIVDCIFAGNVAVTNGGALEIAELSGEPVSVSVTNCAFSANSAVTGGAIRFKPFISSGSALTVVNCTLAGNSAFASGGALFSSRNPGSFCSIGNSVIWSNSPDQIFDESEPTSVSYSNIQGGIIGMSNIDENPLLIDPDGADDLAGTADDNLRLALGSPSVDAGNDALVPGFVVTDLGHLPRFIDGDGDGTPTVDMGAYEFHPTLTNFIVNLTQSTGHGTIADAIAAAVHGDDLLASFLAFQNEPDIDFHGRAVTLTSTGEIDQGDGLYILADGATLAAASGMPVSLDGELRVKSGDAADVLAGDLIADQAAELNIRTDAGLFINVDGIASLNGETTLFTGATLGVSGTLENAFDMTLLSGASVVVDGEFSSSGSMLTSDVTVVADGFTNDMGGVFIGHGEIFAPVHNDGEMTCVGNTIVVGDCTNDGLIVIQIGTLNIIGSLTNNGTIIGAVITGAGAGEVARLGDGVHVGGDYAAAPTAGLLLPDPVWRLTVDGDYDVAITESASYHMVDAELRLAGGLSAQNLEIMSLDVGADPAGFDRGLPGHFPLGTLRIGGTSIVDMIDAHDNDGQGQDDCEAIYVKDLIIEPGATLNTLGCPVYYGSLILDGVVDDPANLHEVEPPPPCPADLNGDSGVDVQDLLILLGAWGATGGDVTGDGMTDVSDLLALLAGWGPCP
ncbi:MAG: right-handed parallel beta-helix repeat-containing protein [Planctomycetota bacterium]|jgi:predicted outer membrane repeat protein